MDSTAFNAHDDTKVDADPFHLCFRVAVGTVSVAFIGFADAIEQLRRVLLITFGAQIYRLVAGRGMSANRLLS